MLLVLRNSLKAQEMEHLSPLGKGLIGAEVAVN
jgi:hypothetical protein